MSGNESGKIAVVDDYEPVALTLATYLRHMGCTPVVFTDPLEFLEAMKETVFDIVITDIRMPQMDGLSLLKKVMKRAPGTQVIMVSANAEKKDAIEALKLGAYDFFEKPVSESELVATIKRTLGYKRIVEERDALADRLTLVADTEAKKWGLQAFVGNSLPMKEVLKKVRLLQKSRKTNVLVLGESGTGKELVARAIHFGSERAKGPFVTVNCSAIPTDLAESILFGHIKGSFTGATADRKGQFELADGGTLFLDEIGDMPALVQTKLLRVLEDGVITPVGGSTGRTIDVRVVSATNTDIMERTASGKFRSDLYHRLAGYEITLPPLRDRSEDLPALVLHFAALLAEEMGIAQPTVAKRFVDSLKGYTFPGNIRELRNIMERALIDASGRDLDVECLQSLFATSPKCAPSAPPVASPGDAKTLPYNLKEAEKLTVQRTLDHTHGNVAEASRLLGISRARVYRILG